MQPLLEARQRLRAFLAANGPASRQELAQALGLVTRTAGNLGRLLRAGQLAR